jgi:hypothetical protein
LKSLNRRGKEVVTDHHTDKKYNETYSPDAHFISENIHPV